MVIEEQLDSYFCVLKNRDRQEWMKEEIICKERIGM